MKRTLPLLSAAFISSLAAADAFKPAKNPEKVSTDFFTTMGDLEVTVWATTPMLFNPTNMDIDHHGRIWVAEGVNYRRHAGRRPGGDRIVVLQDTTGDGKADSSHTFVQEKGLIAPLGVAVFDNRIYVSQPPDLILYTDVDRNLKFDPKIDKREVILTGFNARNHDHSLHSVTGGPDGKMYFNNGNCGAVFTDQSGKKFIMGAPYNGGGGEYLIDHITPAGEKSDDGHVWTAGFTARMDPDGSNVEITGHGYRNAYEQSLNSYGDAFQSDNDDPPACRVSFILEYASAGYFTRDAKLFYSAVKRPGQDHARAHWRQDDPGTMDAGDIYGGGSPTGVTMYENGALPESFIGSFFACEPGRNTIFHYLPEPLGATYKLERGVFTTTNTTEKYYGSDFVGGRPATEEPFLFRPSDICVGPDGAIYISDWYDPGVGGHAARDKSTSGTIYRIAPKGFKPVIPEFDLTTAEGAATALKSPAINTRYLGFEALAAMGEKALPEVEKILADENPFISARALWLLPRLGKTGVAKSEKLLASDDPMVRLTTFRALRRAGAETLPLAKKLASDPNPAVRRDVALSLRDLPAEKTAPIFVTLAKQVDQHDKNALEAIGLGATNQESAIWEALKIGMNPGDPTEWDDRFVRLTWRLWPTSAIPDLKARAASTDLTHKERAFAVESIAFINHPDAAKAMLDLANIEELKNDTTMWLLRNGIGEWQEFGLAKELKDRGIYDPDNIVVTSVTVPEPESNDPKFSVKDVLALKGDPTKGKTTALRCAMCHKFDEVGVDYGPNLKGWGPNQPLDIITKAIVEPSADIAHGFSGTAVKLKKGEEVHGLPANKGDPLIITSTGGITQMIPRKMIAKESRLRRSLMLSADQLGLSAQDVADIVAYLQEY